MLKRGLEMNDFQDLESLSEELSGVTDDALGTVGRLAKRMAFLTRQKSDLEDQIKSLDLDLRKIQEEHLPAALAEHGLKEITLEDGTKVTINRFYAASIRKDRMSEAFKWLNEHGFGDLIKNQVAVNFSRGQEELAEKFAAATIEEGYVPSQKKWVEPMTLKAFVREQTEAGNEVPSDLFGVYIGEKAKIERKT